MPSDTKQPNVENSRPDAARSAEEPAVAFLNVAGEHHDVDICIDAATIDNDRHFVHVVVQIAQDQKLQDLSRLRCL